MESCSHESNHRHPDIDLGIGSGIRTLNRAHNARLSGTGKPPGALSMPLSTGIRNALLNPFSTDALRPDMGGLWENWVIAEIAKQNIIEGSP